MMVLTHFSSERPKMRETTALGVCFAAGCAVGIWKGVDDLIHLKHSAMDLDVFDPNSTEEGKRVMIDQL